MFTFFQTIYLLMVNKVNSVAYGSVVIGVRPVTKRSLIGAPLRSLDVVYCVL